MLLLLAEEESESELGEVERATAVAMATSLSLSSFAGLSVLPSSLPRFWPLTSLTTEAAFGCSAASEPASIQGQAMSWRWSGVAENSEWLQHGGSIRISCVLR